MSPEPKWAGNQPPDESGGGGGASTLTELTDVTGDPGYGKSPVDDGSATFPFTRVTTQEDLEAVLAAVAAVEWHDLALQSGFTNHGQGYAPARYRLTLNNLVFVEGRVNHVPALTVSNVGLPIAQLPPEAAPGFILSYIVAGDGQNRAQLEVGGGGLITFAGFLSGTAQVNWLSLSGLVFSVDGPSPVILKALEAMR